MNSILFSLSILVLGIILIVSNFNIDNAIKSTCTDDALHNSNKGILVLAVAAIVFSLSNMTCTWKCDCSNSGVLATELYVGLIFLLGIVLISLGITIQNKAKKSLTCKKAGAHATAVITAGSLMTAFAGSYLIYVVYTMNKHRIPSGHRAKAISPGTEMTSRFGG